MSTPTATAGRRARITAITSGKGGVGKTFLSANLATALARQGEKVLAALARAGRAVPALELGLWDVPPCGQPGEVLQRLGLGAAGIARSIMAALG